MKKIVNVKKFIISNTILFLLILLFSCTIINHTYSFTQTKYKTIYVTSGETLWEIAEIEQQKNSYYHDKDVRDIIQNIKKVNNLKVSNLKIGQELKIPIN